MIRVVVVDDQALVRAGLRLILDTEPDLEIVAECGGGNEVVAAVREHRPDIVLMDARMPGTDGIAATAALRAEPDGPPVLMLTTFDDDDVLWGALEAGAGGFILKDAEAADLVRAVHTVADGGSWLDARVTPRVLGALRDRATPVTSSSREELDRLSEREIDVLRLMATGANNREIADALFVAERTVKSHVSSIFTKLGVRDRAGAIVLAFEAGLAKPVES